MGPPVCKIQTGMYPFILNGFALCAELGVMVTAHGSHEGFLVITSFPEKGAESRMPLGRFICSLAFFIPPEELRTPLLLVTEPDAKTVHMVDVVSNTHQGHLVLH